MNLNIQDNNGNTPLHFACINDKVKAVMVLLAKGADIYVYNKNGEIPFLSAFKNRSRKVLTFFVTMGNKIFCNDEKKDKDGGEENEKNLLNAIKKNDLETVKTLLKIPTININCQDEDGNTPLNLAFINDNVDIAILLMARGVDIYKTNKKGSTFLHTAAENNSNKALNFFFELIDIIDGNKDEKDKDEEDKNDDKEDEEDKDGDKEDEENNENEEVNDNEDDINDDKLTEKDLYYAFIHKNINLVKKIIKLPNIDINCKLSYNYGYTALHYACKEGYTDIVKELLELPNIYVNCRAFKNTKEANQPDYESVFLLNSDYTPLILSIKNGKPEIAKLLLNHPNIDVNCQTSIDADDNPRYSALHYALYLENVEVLELLLNKKGINVDPKNISGKTPFHMACLGGYFEAVKLLYEKGANINTEDNYGNTPLLDASVMRNYDVVDFLLKNGADRTLRLEFRGYKTVLDNIIDIMKDSYTEKERKQYSKIIGLLTEDN